VGLQRPTYRKAAATPQQGRLIPIALRPNTRAPHASKDSLTSPGVSSQILPVAELDRQLGVAPR
jgi:hypothetical protein